jgi:DNA repair protein REV1
VFTARRGAYTTIHGRLHHDIVQHGGGFLQYLDSKTMATHIITANLTLKKAAEFSRYRIVKPTWVVDSIKAGKLLPWTDYRVITESPSQKVLMFGSSGGLTQTSPSPVRRSYKEQTENSFYTHQIKAEAQSQSTNSLLDKPFLPNREQPERSDDMPPNASGLMVSKSGDEMEYSANVADIGQFKVEPEVQLETDSASLVDPSKLPPKHMTSEEHNAWLLSDPRIRQSSTANPDFLKQFYSESRLHHLSTWKASLKSSMQRLASEKGLSNQKKTRRPGSRRYIMHVDFDSFFCAQELVQKLQAAIISLENLASRMACG